VSERISYMIEIFSLLLINYSGTRKKYSAEQALILLLKHIYKAWKTRKILSLVSFDVKGAYNEVCKE
jgi:hypothetical protein